MSARRLVVTAVVSCCCVVGTLVNGSMVAWAAGPPVVGGESVASVGQDSATVNAQIDPEGVSTSYYFEYGPSASYGSKTTEFNIGSGEGPVTVSAPLTGLTPGTNYYFRVVAISSDGTVPGAEVSFTTYPAGLSGLPDGRVYEMVTPPENRNAEVYAPNPGPNDILSTYLPFQASAEGDAVVYESEPTVGGDGTTGPDFGNTQLARRSPGGGWAQTTLQPNGQVKAIFQGFSSNLSTGTVETCNQPVLGSGAPVVSGEKEGFIELGYNVLYARNNSENSYQPLVTLTPPNRVAVGEVPARFGASGIKEIDGQDFGCYHALVFGGASQDFNHLLFEANDMLLEGEGRLAQELNSDVKHEVEDAKEAERLDQEAENLENTGKKLEEEGKISGEERNELYIKQASVLEGEARALLPLSTRNELYVSVDGRLSLVNVLPGGAADPNATFGAEGPDFSRVISDEGSRIFWTDLNTGIVYVRENASSSSASTVAVSGGFARFQTASSDGQYAFYTEGEMLYRFDVESGMREVLTGVGAGVQGVIGASEDGSRLYFVADGDLAAGATLGQSNLYIWHAGTISFIAALSEEDSNDWAVDVGSRTAQVTPDGNGLVFMSGQSLTGYRNEGQQEVYVYQAEPAGLSCASCSETGIPGSSGFLQQSWSNVDPAQLISGDGDRVFFDSSSLLVPQATSGGQQVYEWERDGTGSCSRPGGCVFLLSDGIGEAALIGASVSGNDAFFVTTASLASEDGNEYPDVYDARVEGAPVAQLACSGTACQGVPSAPPPFATPASVTFAGVGNFLPPATTAVKARAKPMTRSQKLIKALKACKVKRGRKRTACEVIARKRYGAKSKTKKHKANKSATDMGE